MSQPLLAAKARAYVLFPEPELPKTRTFIAYEKFEQIEIDEMEWMALDVE